MREIKILPLIITRKCSEDGSFLLKENDLSIDNFEQLYLESSKEFIKQSNNSLFRNGILVSSYSLFLNLLKLDFENLKLIKKKRQTIEKLVIYYSRASFKTSPFNTFNTISIFQLINENEIKSIIDRKIYSKNLNSRIIANFLLLIKSKLRDLPALSVELNTNLIKENNEFKIIITNRGNVQTRMLKSNPVLDEIYFKMKDLSSISLFNLNDFLTMGIDATSEQISSYLNDLVYIGFLTISVNRSLFNDKRDGNFLNFLADISGNNLVVNQIEKIYKELNDTVNCAEINEHSIWSKLENIVETINPLLENGNSYKIESLETYDKTIEHKIINPFNVHKLFYADYFDNDNFNEKHIVIRSRLEIIDSFLSHLDYFDLGTRLRNFIDVLLKEYLDNKELERVSLIDFYIYFTSLIHNKNIIIEDLELKWREDLNLAINEISKIVKFNSKSEIIIEIGELTTVLKQFPFERAFDRGSSSCYVMNTNDNTWVINALGKGYGMTIGRFFNASEISNYSNVIKDFNNALWENFNVVEIIDDGMHNTNMHPALTDFEILFDKNIYLSSDTNKIFLSEIYLKIEDGKSQLFSEKSSKPLIPLNLSLQIVNQRTGLYQFLSFFGPTDVDFSPIEKATLKHAEEKDGIKILQRIKISDDIIIRRKTWYISKMRLEIFLVNKYPENILAIVEFLRSNDCPLVCFISGLSVDSTSKPAFFNLSNPLFFKQFKKLIDASETIKITEILPVPSNSTNFSPIKENIYTWYFK